MKKEDKRNFFEKSRLNFIESVENSSIPWSYYIGTIIAVLFLRNVIEGFSTKAVMDDGLLFIHYSFFYILSLLYFALIFFIITKTKPHKSLKILIPFFSLILLAPILDILITYGEGAKLCYVTAKSIFEINIFALINPVINKACGVSVGLSIELMIMFILAFIYFFIKTKNILKSMLGFVLLYFGILLFAYEPFFLDLIFNYLNFSKSSLNYYQSNLVFLLTNFILSLFLFIILTYIQNKSLLKLIIFDSRPFRLIHFILMLFFGALVASRTVLVPSFELLNLLLCSFAVFCAWQFCVIQNNIVDKKIDSVSNKQRPLQIGIDQNLYKNISYLFLFLASIFSIIIGFFPFFIIFSFISAYYFYSMPPIRFKRIPILSKLVISFNSLILIVLGFYLFQGVDGVISFISEIILLILVGFTLAINFIDIKDYAGDKMDKIKTLPVLIGLKKSKIIIGLFFVLSYLMAFFILKKDYLLIPIIILAAIQFFLITRKNYSEPPIFVIYFVSIILFCYFYLLR